MEPDSRRSWLVLGLVIAVSAGSLACSNGPTDSAAGPTGLDAFFGFSVNDYDVDKAIHLAVEESLEACMARQGFDYFPQPFESTLGLNAESISLVALEARRDSGFGVTKSEVRGAEEEGSVDPNFEYFESLEDSEKDQYFATLGDGEVGCMSDALPGWVNDPLWEQIPFQEIEERMSADPSYIEIVDRWARCMSSSGFEISAFEDLLPLVYANMPESVDGRFDNREVEAAIALEIDLAVSDHECIAGERGKMQQIRAAHESRWIEENEALLSGLREQMAESIPGS